MRYVVEVLSDAPDDQIAAVRQAIANLAKIHEPGGS
jgi:hypothetical protein